MCLSTCSAGGARLRRSAVLSSQTFTKQMLASVQVLSPLRQCQGRAQDFFFFEGQDRRAENRGRRPRARWVYQAPSPPARRPGERCELPLDEQGSRESPDRPKVFHHFQHYNIVNCGPSYIHWGRPPCIPLAFAPGQCPLSLVGQG